MRFNSLPEDMRFKIEELRKDLNNSLKVPELKSDKVWRLGNSDYINNAYRYLVWVSIGNREMTKKRLKLINLIYTRSLYTNETDSFNKFPF